MAHSGRNYAEKAFVKTKIIATVGPASESRECLRDLAIAGVDVFRLNFAHGTPEWRERLVAEIRAVSREVERPLAILGDLGGPKIRLGELPEEGIFCGEGEQFEFVRTEGDGSLRQLTCTYPRLIDDLKIGDYVLLADGTVSMQVVEKAADKVSCTVHRSGTIRSRQGVNLPGVELSLPTLTEKDHADLAWAVAHQFDFIGLSFVRSADDIRQARGLIEAHAPQLPPRLIAKIEKLEAVSQLDAILGEADAVMVARGDLGVEVDIARVPALQKRIIRLCNQHRLPVITATQMLDSMQSNSHPTRAEASDVANAVLDGSDAVMLSGETAAGNYPVQSVAMMSRIAREAERLIETNKTGDTHSSSQTRARLVTEAVTLGASTAAEHLDADLIVVATHSGRTAMAISKQRSQIPIVALTDQEATARRMCLYWGVTPVHTDVVHRPPDELLRFVVEWGREHRVLHTGSRLVLVAGTDWSAEGHDMLLVHLIT